MRSRLHHGPRQQQIEYLRARTQATTAALRPDRSIGAPAKAASLIGSPIQNEASLHRLSAGPSPASLSAISAGRACPGRRTRTV